MPDDDAISTTLAELGISKTIYSLVMPETEAALDRVLDGSDGSWNRQSLHEMYREAWTQKQDRVHSEMFEAWRNWSSPVIEIAPALSHQYPTGGASEGIRELIYSYGLRARVEGFAPKIHTFKGEYEGYRAYASAAGISVQAHDRGQWRESMASIGNRDEFYLSHPSAIDGNVWSDYEEFCDSLFAFAPGCRLQLDVTYVGCVARQFRLPATSPNIANLLFSLSKPMGVYYHRIGGLLAREEKPGLYGNRWFKNLLSLRLATELLKSHDVFELPGRYRELGQLPAVEQLSRALGVTITPSDVFLLASGSVHADNSEVEQFLIRDAGSHSIVRYCLTPRIAQDLSI